MIINKWLLGKTKHGASINQYVCAACVKEGQSHPQDQPLHRAPIDTDTGEAIYVCEIHAIIFGGRKPTPSFLSTEKALKEIEDAKV